jgi:hypothetical protein
MYYFNYTLALVLLSCVAAVINGVIGMLGKEGGMEGLDHYILLLCLTVLPPSFPQQLKAS